jgi:hypothetical protein
MKKKAFSVSSVDWMRLSFGDSFLFASANEVGIVFVLIVMKASDSKQCFEFMFIIQVFSNMLPGFFLKFHDYDELCDLVIFHLACFIAVNFTHENRFSETCDHSSCQVVENEENHQTVSDLLNTLEVQN